LLDDLFYTVEAFETIRTGFASTQSFHIRVEPKCTQFGRSLVLSVRNVSTINVGSSGGAWCTEKPYLTILWEDGFEVCFAITVVTSIAEFGGLAQTFCVTDETSRTLMFRT
jgi:hypothetical protein